MYCFKNSSGIKDRKPWSENQRLRSAFSGTRIGDWRKEFTIWWDSLTCSCCHIYKQVFVVLSSANESFLQTNTYTYGILHINPMSRIPRNNKFYKQNEFLNRQFWHMILSSMLISLGDPNIYLNTTQPYSLCSSEHIAYSSLLML